MFTLFKQDKYLVFCSLSRIISRAYVVERGVIFVCTQTRGPE